MKPFLFRKFAFDVWLSIDIYIYFNFILIQHIKIKIKITSSLSF